MRSPQAWRVLCCGAGASLVSVVVGSIFRWTNVLPILLFFGLFMLCAAFLPMGEVEPEGIPVGLESRVLLSPEEAGRVGRAWQEAVRMSRGGMVVVQWGDVRMLREDAVQNSRNMLEAARQGRPYQLDLVVSQEPEPAQPTAKRATDA